MHTKSMLDIDPDKLFEEKSISEIEEVQKKIQDEVERKKEELRTMVGERYRDLIEAADTISAMQVTAADVISRVKSMESLCSELQQRQLLGFQLDLTRPLAERNDNAGIAIAVQTKMLVSIPEQIWLAVERDDFLLGTQLYLLARHIKTGLLLGTSPFLDSMMSVITRQWASISHFQEKLVSGAQESLALADIAPQAAAQCLCVFALLHNMNGGTLLNRFLDVRKQALHNALLQGDDKTSVKRRVALSLHLLLRSLSLLLSCFVEDRAGYSEGLVWQHLHALTRQDTSPPEVSTVNACGVLDLFDLLGVEPAALRFLPPVVREFIPSSSASKETLQLPQVRDHTSRWLEDIQIFLKETLSKLFSFVTSIKFLQSIRDAAVKLQQDAGASGWDTALQKLQLPCGSDVWMAYYQPLLTCRVRALVEEQWTSALAALRQKLADELRAVLRDKTQNPENDLRWLVWRERSSDLPHHSTQGVPLSQNHGLLLKCRGYSPRVEALCQSFDTPLRALLHELSNYARDNDVDREEIQHHLQQCSTDCLKKLCSHLEENCLAGATGREEASVVLVARLLGALCDLCPAIQTCFVPLIAMSSTPKVRQGGVSAAWTDMVTFLQSSSKHAWTVWQELVSAQLCSTLQKKLLPELGHLGTLLLHSTPWEEHSMEEHGEEGGRLHSVIRVPVQPSLALQKVLAEACHVLGAAQPHTVPSFVRTAFVERLITDILGRYHTAVTPELAQSQAVQFLLDIKFLASLFIPRTHKVLSNQAQELCQLLEERIDPFDLDIFTPFLQDNVRQSVRHMQCLLGVLVSCWPEKLASMWSSGTSADKHNSATTEQPSMLAMCPAAPWFPLLPVVLPNNSSVSAQPPPPPEKTQNKRSAGTRSPKRRAEPMENIKSGAAAFFGAMSSDWFS